MNCVYIPVEKELSEDDWYKIDLFKKRFNILWGNFRDLNLGTLSGSFNKNDNGCYTGKFELPSFFRLKGLYVDYRHFYLQQEPTNYNKFANFLSNITTHRKFHLFIREEKKRWKCDFVENEYFKFKDTPIAINELLDLWFNGEIFHSKDKMKTEKLLQIFEIFESDTAQSILFMAVYDTILAIKNLNWIIQEISIDNKLLRMPHKT